MAEDEILDLEDVNEEEEEAWRPTKLSFSMAGTYQQCPRRWKNQYLLGVRVGTPIPALIGGFAHSILEYLYKEEPPQRTLEVAKDIATYLWDDQIKEEHFIQHNLNAAQAKEFKRTVWRNITGIFQMEDPQKIEVIATEQKLKVEIDGVPYGGYVDRLDAVDDGVKVVDYKTGKPGDKRYHSKKLKQVQLYAAMVREELGYNPTRVSLVFPAFQETIDAKVTTNSMKKVTTELGFVWEDINNSIDNDDFPPSTGPLCAWCDFVGDCPEGQIETLGRWKEGRVREDAPAVAILGLK